jgi:hypothetical protein
MPTFHTPEPVSATIDIVLGDVRITAADRDDTAVDVRPTDATSDDDVKAAELTRVYYGDGHLLVKTPKLRSWLSRSAGGSVDVTIGLPAGSHLHGAGHRADFHCAGRLGDCRITIGLGRIRLERAGALRVKSGSGDVSADLVTGHAEVTAASGDIELRELDAGAVIKSSNGDIRVGIAGGDLRVKTANGSIAVDVAQASVGAKSANGDVRVGEVGRGSVVLETYAGDVEVGIRAGTAAWLDVSASAGQVVNELEAADAAQPPADTAEVRARTAVGDIVVRRAGSGDAPPSGGRAATAV